MKEELGIIKGINFGLRDCNRPIIWFEVDTLSGTSLQIIEMNNIEAFMKEADCCKLSDLNGKPCVMATDGFRCKFIRFKT